MKTLRTPLVAVAVLTSCAAFAQVTVITPDSEHVYSSDPARPQQLPDDKALRLQNERAEREREQADQAASSNSQSPNTYPNTYQPPKSEWEGVYQPPTSAWDSPNYQPPKSGWDDR